MYGSWCSFVPSLSSITSSSHQPNHRQAAIHHQLSFILIPQLSDLIIQVLHCNNNLWLIDLLSFFICQAYPLHDSNFNMERYRTSTPRERNKDAVRRHREKTRAEEQEIRTLFASNEKKIAQLEKIASQLSAELQKEGQSKPQKPKHWIIQCCSITRSTHFTTVKNQLHHPLSRTVSYHQDIRMYY